MGIVGLGLVGGSLALDLVDRGRDVLGTDIDPEHRRLAAAADIDVAPDIASTVEVADLVVVAVPPGSVATVVAEVTRLAPEVVVTDVASVKSLSALGLEDPSPRWVGGHPMAGTERSGFPAARRGMLAGATWLLTPRDTVDAEALLAVLDLVLAVDAVPVIVDPVQHDRLVAAVSHVTHLLSYALYGVASDLGREVVELVAGPSFRDATRVAASDPHFWADLIHRNRDAVAEILADVQSWLGDATTDDADALADRLAGARRRPVAATPDDATVDLVDLLTALPELRRLGEQGYAVAGVERTEGSARLRMHRR